MKRLLLVIPIALVALAALIWSQQRHEPFFVSGFIESHQIRVGSHVGGRIQAVHIAEGDRVSAGAKLLEFEPYDLSERLAQTQAALAAQQARLEKLRAGSRPEEIAGAKAARDRAQAVLDKLVAGPRPLEIKIREDALALAQADLVKAQKDYERISRLVAAEQGAQEELDDATRALAVAQARVDSARDELALLKEGTRAEDIAEATALLAQAEQTLALLEAGARAEDIAEAEALVASSQAAVAIIQRQMAELIVTAPVDSVVEAADLRPGDLIAPGAPVIALTDMSDLWVRAYVPENRLDLKLGQRVSLRVDSFPDRRFAGHLTFISRDAEFTPSNVQTPEERVKQVFRIKVTLDEGRDVLRAGMSADVFLEETP
ncbi:MAG: efflux RND transporter periplasmic adaptor subunit [Phycisphaerae bacterium]|jgi:multidrug resistance efflux pump